METKRYQVRKPRRTRRHVVRDIDYAVHEWGEPGSPLLLCLHGWGDSGATFQSFVDALGESWHIVAPDWRGFGDSGRNAGAYWYPDYVADLSVLVNIYSPDAPVAILGHSMGGNVAGLYAGVFPERVRAFVNAEGFGLADSDPDSAPARYRRWIERLAVEETFSVYRDYASLAAKIHGRNPRMSRAYAQFVAEQWGREQDGQITLKADPRHRLPNAVLYRRAEAEACWRAVTAPVLMLTGANSSFRQAGHPHDGRFDFELPFPRVSKLTLPDCGHMLHFEAPGPLAAAASDFLRQTV
ncbi:MAG: alpha/beta hydrolase [Pseudomonadota bacterium]